MPESLSIEVEEEVSGERLDRFLRQNLEEWSRSVLQRWIGSGAILVNGKAAKPSYRIRTGDRVAIRPPPPQPLELVPQDLPLEIVFEDEFLVVLDKPSGLVVHPGAGRPDGTLANALLFHFQNLSRNQTFRPGIVHRLDKDTSGLMVVAKGERAHEQLAAQFRDRLVSKGYVALLYGNLDKDSGRIDRPIGRHPSVRTRMAVLEHGGRSALTEFVVSRRYEDFSLLDVKPHTGRTHQIRVHFHSVGHPVVGDLLYGGQRYEAVRNPRDRKEVKKLERHFLHSSRLAFVHPATRGRMEFESALPADLSRLLSVLH